MSGRKKFKQRNNKKKTEKRIEVRDMKAKNEKIQK
jgi:hypothetical protein